MEKLLEFLNNNPWLNIVFLVLAVLSIVATIITYLYSKTEKKPVYKIKNLNIISSSISKVENLSIDYNNQKIEELSVCYVTIANFGNKAIRKEDIPEKDKVRIEIDGGDILASKITYQTKEINNFNLALSDAKNCIIVEFDFIDKYEGLTIQLFHTMSNDEKIRIYGTVIEGKQFQRIENVFKMWNYFEKINNWVFKGTPFDIFKVILVIPIVTIIYFPALYQFIIMNKKIPKELIWNKSEYWL